MKNLILITLALIALVVTTTGLIPVKRDSKKMRDINVKDISEHGLIIISSADAAFSNLINSALQIRPEPLAEELKSYSVFVKNESQRAVIAYSIKWEFLRPDGRIVTKRRNFITRSGLIGQGENAKGKNIINPGETRFLSLVDAFKVDDKASNSSDNDESGTREQMVLTRGAQPKDFAKLTNELAGYTGVTISLDGAFFEDGAFVGAGTSDFFARTKAMRDARYDLLLEIENQLQEGKSAKDALNQLEALTKETTAKNGIRSTPSDYYQLYRQRYAEELLRTRNAAGDEPTVKKILASVAKPWPQLRKL